MAESSTSDPTDGSSIGKICGVLQQKGGPCQDPARSKWGTCMREAHIKKRKAELQATETAASSRQPSPQPVTDFSLCRAQASFGSQCVHRRESTYWTCTRKPHRDQELELIGTLGTAPDLEETAIPPPLLPLPAMLRPSPPLSAPTASTSHRYQSLGGPPDHSTPLNINTDIDMNYGGPSHGETQGFDAARSGASYPSTDLFTPKTKEALLVAEDIKENQKRCQGLENSVAEIQQSQGQFRDHLRMLPHVQFYQDVPNDIAIIQERISNCERLINQAVSEETVERRIRYHRNEIELSLDTQIESFRQTHRQSLYDQKAESSKLGEELKAIRNEQVKMKEQFSSLTANEEKMKQHCEKVSSTTNSFIQDVNETTTQQAKQLDTVKIQTRGSVEEVREEIRDVRKKAEKSELEVQKVSTATSSAMDARLSAALSEIDQLKNKLQAYERRTDGIISQQRQERSEVDQELEGIKGRFSTLGLTAAPPAPPPPPPLPPLPQAAQSLDHRHFQSHAPLSLYELQEAQKSKLEDMLGGFERHR